MTVWNCSVALLAPTTGDHTFTLMSWSQCCWAHPATVVLPGRSRSTAAHPQDEPPSKHSVTAAVGLKLVQENYLQYRLGTSVWCGSGKYWCKLLHCYREQDCVSHELEIVAVFGPQAAENFAEVSFSLSLWLTLSHLDSERTNTAIFLQLVATALLLFCQWCHCCTTRFVFSCRLGENSSTSAV